ncbi:alpha-protein kinase 3 isoform X2 [Sorex fumeus]|uniref:alpha-protein kinase 3 isoform X2 n=1 Tax=Sorex fumeus TaxID=62283 RepID=UPI0024AE70EA|nr:alpha-protein kinase 3 isoform X2 [Sorex fumeus]
MGSRRGLGHGWGAGLRSGAGGDSEDEGPVWTPGPASRSYLLSVRPEASLPSSRPSHPGPGRSTFCSIIAQLTEETQPVFQTTLRSRAVSQGSDVKFSCVVTGYPEPEVTWYKDDVELDRYCGLPKYEITRQGNCHTLQLYRCQEEDAAIYQASAHNSKGIVSCSGVLEVGPMTEYKIHQRWFARLKRKAVAKMRDMEQNWKQGKGAVDEADALRKLSPDRFQRKRRLSGAQAPAAPSKEVEVAPPQAWQAGEAEPGPQPGLGLAQSVAPGERTPNGEAAPKNGEDAEQNLLGYICEAMELGTHRTPPKGSGAKKKKKDERPPPGGRSPSTNENSAPSSDKSDTQGPLGTVVATDAAQSQPRGRTAGGQGSPVAESRRRSAPDSPGQAPSPPAPAPLSTSPLSPAQASVPAPPRASTSSLTPTPAPARASAPVQTLAPDPAQASAPVQTPAPPRAPAPVQTPAPPRAPAPVPTPALTPARAPAPVPTPALTPARAPGPVPTQAPPRAPAPVPTSDPAQTPVPVQTPAPPRAPAPVQTPTPPRASAPVPTPAPDPSRATAPVQTSALPRASAPVQTLAPARPPAPVQTPAPARPPAPVQTPAPARPPAPVQTLAPARPPAPVQIPAPSRPPAPVQIPAPTRAPAPVQTPAPAGVSTSTLCPIPAPVPVPVSVLIPARVPAPSPDVYFSLKDLYAESTQTPGPQREEDPQSRGVPGKAPSQRTSDPGQPTPTPGPEAPKPFNRKRFAPPKPKGDPSAPPGQAPDPAAPSSGKTQSSAAPAPSPTPPARRRAGAPGEAPSAPATLPPSPLANSRAEQDPAGHGMPTSQVPTEPVDTAAQGDKSMCADRVASDRGNAQVERRPQGQRRTTVDEAAGERGRPEPDQNSLEDVVAQERLGTRAERMQEDGSMQDERRQKGENLPTTVDGQPEKVSVSGLSPQPLAPGPPPSEGPPLVTESPGLTPQVSAVASPGSDEAEAPASGQQRAACPGLATGTCSRQRLPADGPEPPGGATPLDGGGLTLPGPLEQLPGEPPCVGAAGCPPAVPSPGVSNPSSCPQEGPPSTAAPPFLQAAPQQGQSQDAPAASRHRDMPRPRSCDPGLIDSLKNYLLLLLQLSGAEPGVEVAGLSPRTSRRLLEQAGSDHLVQSAQILPLSPCTSRRLTGLLEREAQALDAAARGSSPGLSVPAIVVGEEIPGQETPEPVDGELQEPLPAEGSSPEPPQGQAQASPEEAPTSLPGATPQELALGARRKRFLPKAKAAGEDRDSPTVSPRGSRKGLAPGSPGRERRSPTQARRASLLEVPRAEEEPAEAGMEAAPEEAKQDGPAKPSRVTDPLKAPQVIRKIRVEAFADTSGSLKLWCQFFNLLSDSVLTWTKDQRPVGETGRSAGDEGPAALAIVRASDVDCGVYRCEIRNEHGAASTDFRLSPEVLSGFISREEGEVGEEIEMTPMVFAKGLAGSGCWGDKLFGRLVSEELPGRGRGCGLRKASRAKVIYGLEPVFESGCTCIIKVSSLLVFGPSSETSLLGRNYDVTIQGCKIQNMTREYCKIFASEARAVPGFGEVPEVIPLYLIYRPANHIPYATLEEDLGQPLEVHCSREWGGSDAPGASETSHKCQTFQHWLLQWTNGSFLVTDLAGVGWKMTDVQIATKQGGYQGLKESCAPALLDQFAASHRCNAFCAMLGLTALKGPEPAHPQGKAKGSKSPSSGRKGPQLSPQHQRRGLASPQGTRRAVPSSKASGAQSPGQVPPRDGAPKAQGLR